MSSITIAIPSETSEELASKRSDHFGHCPLFTVVEITDNKVTQVQSINNLAHEAGGCMKPVVMLADKGVTAMVVAGMGRGPFQKIQQLGLKVYFADLLKCPDVQSAIDCFVNGTLPAFGDNQLCTGGGTCQH